MKKFIFVPIMAISLLASCSNGGGTHYPPETFTITFKNDGDPDKKIEDIKAGSIVEEIPNPITPKPNATFIGWCTDTGSKNVFDFSKIKIYQDYTLYSGWKEDEPTYNVIFYAGEGSYDTGKFISKKNVPAGTKILSLFKDLDTPELDGNTFTYYDYMNKNDDIDYDDIVTSDTVLRANFSPTVDPIDVLDNLDWETIKKIAVTGDPSKWFNIGATKKVEINGKEHDVQIIGFKHKDDVTMGGIQTGITFDFKNVITKSDSVDADTTHWNDKDEDDSTNFEYSKSTLNDFLNITIFDNLPDDLKADGMIEEVYKSVAESEEYEINTYATKLFPLSCGEIGCGSEEEGTVYEFYDGKDIEYKKIKKIVNGDAKNYWSRSPIIHYSRRAMRIATNGRSGEANIYENEFAVAPAFCI